MNIERVFINMKIISSGEVALQIKAGFLLFFHLKWGTYVTFCDSDQYMNRNTGFKAYQISVCVVYVSVNDDGLISEEKKRIIFWYAIKFLINF